MNTYAFLLGRKYLLSIAELIAVLPKETEIQHANERILIASTPTIDNPKKLQNRLGGTIKIIEIDSESEAQPDMATNNVSQIILKKFENIDKKVKYAISTVNVAGKYEQILKSSLKESKKTLKEAGIKSRFINKTSKNPELAQLKGEKFPTEGSEFVIIEAEKKYYYGHTIALQDIDFYSKRDYERPERDARLGMLPPKLAQIMINLAHPGQGHLYDPFCGLGTVQMEAMLMDIPSIGSDIQPEVIEKAQANLDWVNQIHPGNYRLFERDASRINKTDITEKITAVVSETYLGPPMSEEPPKSQIKEIFDRVEQTMIGFFRGLQSITPREVNIVLSILTYRIIENGKEKFITMTHLIDEIRKLGYQVEPLIPEEITEKFGFEKSRNGGLLYERPKQTVCRTIFRFQKA